MYIWVDSGLGQESGDWKVSEAEMALLGSGKGKEAQQLDRVNAGEN